MTDVSSILPVKAFRIVWRRRHKSEERQFFYCNAMDGVHARERCKAFVKREYRVKFPVFVSVAEFG